MVSVAEAFSIVSETTFEPGIKSIRVGDAVNRVLAENIVADRDLPPIDRVTMDGIAISFDSWSGGQRTFHVEDMQAAGMAQKKLNDPSDCLEVMTGAVLPEGTDAVIPYEDLIITNKIATASRASLVRGQNIHKKGSDASNAELLLSKGTILSAAEIALIASVGKRDVKTYAFPVTAIISSGDELVPVESTPAAHQVRRSNTYAVEAAMKMMGWEGKSFHLPDNKEQMTTSMKEIANDFEVMILSGGVSKGKFDFVPAVMEEIGVAKLFHRVNQKPGKPFWFGRSAAGKIVFALPGNPVSTYMCFYRYIRPWVLKSLHVEVPVRKAVLAKDFSLAASMTYFLQVQVRNEDGMLMAYPQPGGGSGDFANLKNVTGFLELPEGKGAYLKGEAFAYYPFRID